VSRSTIYLFLNIIPSGRLQRLPISLGFPRAKWVLHKLMAKVLPFLLLPDIEAKFLQNNFISGTFLSRVGSCTFRLFHIGLSLNTGTGLDKMEFINTDFSRLPIGHYTD